jgi:cytochrome d ubiquinol oxidase subunit II
MDLPILSALFAALSLALYVLLDGFDLGVGALLLLQRDEAARNHMIDSITPTWDGNETWLVMTGITLFASFPIAYGILLPAFYIPVVIMVLALGLRGVSFEFRVQIKQYRRRWDLVFGIGSVAAACMQGLILGGLLQGVSVRDAYFSGSVLDCWRPFPVLCAITVLIAYMVLGSCWLYLKATSVARRFAERALHVTLPTFFVLFGLACFTAPLIQPGIRFALLTHAVVIVIILGLMVIAGMLVFTGVRKGIEHQPFVAALFVLSLGIIGLAVLIFPNVIPFRLSIWEASASRLTQIVFLSGAVCVTPVILTYSAFAYWVFRGKTPINGWEG